MKSATSGERFYALLAAGGELDGVRCVAAESVARMTELQRAGRDRVFDFAARWALGVHAQPDWSRSRPAWRAAPAHEDEKRLPWGTALGLECF